MSALGDQQPVVCHSVDEPIFICDAARPIACQIPSQWLRLAPPRERRAHALLDEEVDPHQNLPVSRLPVEVILPSALGEYELHSMSSRSVPPPLSSSAMASRSRFLFSGLR